MPFEHGGPVVEAVRHHVDVRVAERHEVATEERPQLGGGLHRRGLGSILLLQQGCLLRSGAPTRHRRIGARKYTRDVRTITGAALADGDQCTGAAEAPRSVKSAR